MSALLGKKGHGQIVPKRTWVPTLLDTNLRTPAAIENFFEVRRSTITGRPCPSPLELAREKQPKFTEFPAQLRKATLGCWDLDLARKAASLFSDTRFANELGRFGLAPEMQVSELNFADEDEFSDL